MRSAGITTQAASPVPRLRSVVALVDIAALVARFGRWRFGGFLRCGFVDGPGACMLWLGLFPGARPGWRLLGVLLLGVGEVLQGLGRVGGMARRFFGSHGDGHFMPRLISLNPASGRAYR